MSKKQNYLSNTSTTLLDSLIDFKKDLSHKTIKNYLKNGMVTVNNQVITKGNYQIKEHDLIEISYQKTKIPSEFIDILYEDEYLIAINKPAGLLSISNDKEKNITAYRFVSDYVKKNTKNKYIFVVHRLDQDTSGILLFSKNERVRDKLQQNWNDSVKKRGYIAICEGRMSGSKTIQTYLTVNHQDFIHSTKNKEIGKLAITNYKVLKSNKQYSLLQVFISTGRRNQIRVHLSEQGNPIVGDKKYKTKTNPIKRLCLHANILEFIHPVTNKLITITSEIPDEFNNLIK